ncbi:hypothetical protein KM043_016800 [Ampulex compressa]|nr:hypothetical protein KM043_016800 [Ampulex compressa]
MATIEEGRLCKEDGDCSEKQYCYDVSGRCVDYTQCNRYNRQESQKYSRHPSQCGPCLPGYSTEVVGTGDMALLCKKNSAPQIGIESTKLNGTIIISITLGATLCVVVAAIAIFMFFRRQFGRHENDHQKWSQVCIAGPTAPPAENSPFIGYGELTTSTSYNNNQNVKDKNMLVNASPFKDPNWIRSNPNYEHRLSNNDLNNSEESHSAVQLPLEIDNDTNSWTPEQLTIQVANGALSEYATEHRDNTMNADFDLLTKTKRELKMTESLISEWLEDCVDVSPLELHTFATTLSQDNEIVRALYVLLEERSKYSQLVDTVCDQLYNFYRSPEIELQRFALQFLPTLIYIYLNSAAHGDIKNCRSVETLLIGLYNLEIMDKSGEAKAISFRLPSLAILSLYHEPTSLAPASLTESAIRRFEECNTKLVSWGPLQQVESLNAQNRLKVMTALLFIYNQQLGYIHKFSLEQLCKVATKLVTQGFAKPGHHQRSSYGSESSFVPRLLPRIPVSSQFLLEFLHAIYFAMYNDCWHLGNQAVEDIHNRACYEAYPDVMLVTNAIRNSASSGPSGHPSDGPIGISVALSPATATATVSKSMITNASFRTKKLPDDIPIQVVKEDSAGDDHKRLVQKFQISHHLKRNPITKRDKKRKLTEMLLDVQLKEKRTVA